MPLPRSSADAPKPHRHIEAQGTPESRWRAGRALASVPQMPLDTLVPAGSRAVVVAPHPDDEILAIGGLLATLARQGGAVRILAITDGTASHPGSSWFTPDRLARLRPQESEAALRALGIDPAHAIDRCRVPDGQVAANVGAVTTWLRARLLPSDVMFIPSRFDGHPDHEACASAAWPCADRVARVVECPIWMWHWASPDGGDIDWTAARHIELDADALARKRAAIACFASQISRDPCDPQAGPVLADWAIARWTREFETVFPGAVT